VWPDLTIILDVDLETASQRMKSQLDRMEAKGDGYHQKVREGFLQLVDKRDDFLVVDATHDIESIHKNVVKQLNKAF
jgi:dTMP kinase